MRHKKKNTTRILREQLPSYGNVAKFAPKSEHYREELTPLLGKTVAIRGIYSGDRKRWCGKRIGYVRMICMRDIELITTNGSKQKHAADHIWLNIVDKNTIAGQPLRSGHMIDATGVLYEYISDSKRNVGMRVLSCKNAKCDKKRC